MVLGHGGELVLPGMTLAPGQHPITRTAADSSGNTSSGSATVFVGYGAYLPVIRKPGN